MLPVILTALAQEDIHDIVSYLGEQSYDMGDRFFDQINKTLERLSDMPELGTVTRWKDRRSKPIRIWSVKNFPNHLIFYQVETDELVVLRVLHGSTNYETLFQG